MTKLVKNPIDAHVGAQVKLRRAIVGMSQTELANHLGITFQQVQKYENGSNRISASRLYQIAAYLNVAVETLFKGAEGCIENPPEPYKGAQGHAIQKYEDFIRSPGGIDLCKAFISIENPVVRKQIMAIIKTLSPAQ